MSYTIEDFKRDYIREHLHELPPEEVLSQFSPEDRLRGLPLQEVLSQLSPEDRLRGLPVQEVLSQYSREELEAYLRRMEQSSEKPPQD